MYQLPWFGLFLRHTGGGSCSLCVFPCPSLLGGRPELGLRGLLHAVPMRLGLLVVLMEMRALARVGDAEQCIVVSWLDVHPSLRVSPGAAPHHSHARR
jgi:hypothetical protein